MPLHQQDFCAVRAAVQDLKDHIRTQAFGEAAMKKREAVQDATIRLCFALAPTHKRYTRTKAGGTVKSWNAFADTEGRPVDYPRSDWSHLDGKLQAHLEEFWGGLTISNWPGWCDSNQVRAAVFLDDGLNRIADLWGLSAAKRPLPLPSLALPNPNDPRDKWIYKECCKGTPHGNIVADLKKVASKRKWNIISTKQGIRGAAERYAKRLSLPQPPSRQNL